MLLKYVGEGVAELLAEHIGEIEKFEEITEEALKEIPGIGDKIAQSVVHYFKDSVHLNAIHQLLKNGIAPQKVKISRRKDHAFNGKVFVLTGALEKYGRKDATALIKERGGKVTGSVSNHTDFVLAGQDPGSKLDKARELGIQILTEKEFDKLL